MKLLSVIIPCFNEEESIQILYYELCKEDEKFKQV